jgi:hypothetical protein
MVGGILWVVKSRPNYKVGGRILLGIILTVIFIVQLQSINNKIFDPIFQRANVMAQMQLAGGSIAG